MHTDWSRYENPDVSWIRQYHDLPGLRWDTVPANTSTGHVVRSVQWHLSHWGLMPTEAYYGMGYNVDVGATLPLGVTLRDYQREDLPFMLTRRASILGYEMRLGKTCTATAAHNPAYGPLVILGPLIARDVWRQWCERIHGFAPVALGERYDVAMPGYPAYFVHFDILDAHSKFFQSFNPATLIIDEIHLLQARRSQRMSAASLLASRAERIIGLSGTPMWTNPRTLWPILNLISPSAWGTEFEFSSRYTNAIQGAYGWQFHGTRNEDELRARLKYIIQRRTWKEVVPNLPAVTNVVEPVELTNTDRVKYESIAQKAQLASVASGKQATVAGYLARLRKLFGEAKIRRALQLAIQAIADGHKVVMWTWHVEVANKLLDELLGMNVSACSLSAEQSQDMREHHIAKFQSTIGPAVMVSALAVGGVAIDLSAADLSIFVELDWVPATIYQASMRIFTPTRPSANVFLFADVPVERRLVEVLACNEACQTAAGLGYDEIASKVLEVG